MNIAKKACFFSVFALVGSAIAPLVSIGAEMSQNRSESAAPLLQVQVKVPPAWNPMMDDDVAESFALGLRDIFKRQGYPGKIEYVAALDEPKPGCCLLTIDLIEWRLGRLQNVEATFTAQLQTARQTRNLGVFTHTELFHWSPGLGRLELADVFDDAAAGAIRELYRELARTELIPGLRTS